MTYRSHLSHAVNRGFYLATVAYFSSIRCLKNAPGGLGWCASSLKKVHLGGSLLHIRGNFRGPRLVYLLISGELPPEIRSSTNRFRRQANSTQSFLFDTDPSAKRDLTPSAAVRSLQGSAGSALSRYIFPFRILKTTLDLVRLTPSTTPTGSHQPCPPRSLRYLYIPRSPAFANVSICVLFVYYYRVPEEFWTCGHGIRPNDGLLSHPGISITISDSRWKDIEVK